MRVTHSRKRSKSPGDHCCDHPTGGHLPSCAPPQPGTRQSLGDHHQDSAYEGQERPARDYARPRAHDCYIKQVKHDMAVICKSAGRSYLVGRASDHVSCCSRAISRGQPRSTWGVRATSMPSSAQVSPSLAWPSKLAMRVVVSVMVSVPVGTGGCSSRTRRADQHGNDRGVHVNGRPEI